MPAPDQPLCHVFAGGFASDFGSIAYLAMRDGLFQIPFLTRAENCFFELNGSLRKVGGTSKYNETELESGEEIRGMFEYVRSGTSGSPTRRRVVHAGTKVLSDGNDGNFTDLITGLENDTVPNYTVFTDVLIIASDSTVDVPRKWDQTTVSLLGGSPPNFSFSCAHVNRLWAAGDHTHPSRLYYSAQLNPEDWSSSDAGHIDVEPDDGDRITGIFAHRGVLFVFKGPNFGAIHVITGSTPSDFARRLFSSELGGAGPNTITSFGNDVAFVALDGSIRSLAATDKFGDFEEAALSRGITTWIRSNVKVAGLKRAWARVDPTRGYVLFTLPVESASRPDFVLCMDYRFSTADFGYGRMRFTTWPAFTAYSVARMSDPSDSDRQILYLGGHDGFLRKTQQADRMIDGDSYDYRIKTPFFHYGTQNRKKTISHFGLGIQSHGAATVDFSIRGGPNVGATIEVEAIVGSTLGIGSPLPFVLGTSTLGGGDYFTFWGEVHDAGQFREVSYELDAGEENEDVEINSIHVVIETNTNPDYVNYETEF